MNDCVNYISGGLLGDFICQLYICYENFLSTGKKANLYISDIGDNFRFGKNKAYDDLKDIIKSQKYINVFEIYTNQKIDINLSSWRHNLNNDKSFREIFSRNFNVSWGKEKWLCCNKNKLYTNKILVHCSRGHGSMKWSMRLDFLKNPNAQLFCLSSNEYLSFSQITGYKGEYILFKNLTELTEALEACAGFIGPPSAPLCFALSQGIISLAIIEKNADYNFLADKLTLTYYYYINDKENNISINDFFNLNTNIIN